MKDLCGAWGGDPGTQKTDKEKQEREIEESEQVYWEKRLTRQSMEDMVNRVTGINQGNIRAAISTNGSLGKKLNEISYSRMSGLKDSPNLIAGQSLFFAYWFGQVFISPEQQANIF